MAKAIVFDMDGVLFDTEMVCNIVWTDIFKEIGIENPEITIKNCTGLNRKSEEEYFAKHHPDIDFEWFINRSSEKFGKWLDENGIPMKTGTRELLTWLKGNMWKTALATSSRRETALHHLNATGLTEMFDKIITGDVVTKGKPDPEIYLKACDMLGVLPSETYAVEDSRNGLWSAYNAGMKAILVPDLIEPTEDMLNIAYKKEDNLLDVIEFLKHENN